MMKVKIVLCDKCQGMGFYRFRQGRPCPTCHGTGVMGEAQ